MTAPRTLWLVRDKTAAQISDADRRMMARWLRAAAQNQITKHGEDGARVTMSATTARALADMLDKSPAPVAKNG